MIPIKGVQKKKKVRKSAKKGTSKKNVLSVNIKDDFVINILTKNPNIEITNVIFESTDYDIFGFLKENRDIKRSSVEYWKKQIGEEGKDLDIPFIVDEKFNIYDGQNRFMARMELGLPIYFYITKNIKPEHISDIQKGNKWRIVDYLKHFIAKGKKEYAKYKELFEKFNTKMNKWINHNELRMIVMGHSSFSGKAIKDPFEEGKMKFVRSEKEVNELLEWMFHYLPIKLYADLLRDRYFQRAIVNLYSYENFDKKIFEEMIEVPKYREQLHHFEFIRKEKADGKVKTVFGFYNDVAKKKGDKYILREKKKINN